MDWHLHHWSGPVDAVEAALRDLGWSSSGEEALLVTTIVGGTIPPSGQPVMVVDGVAYAQVVATEALSLPHGVVGTDPEISVALLGSF